MSPNCNRSMRSRWRKTVIFTSWVFSCAIIGAQTALAVTPTRSPTPTQTPLPRCVGDCDIDGLPRDRQVTPEEIRFGVSMALGIAQLRDCFDFDADWSGAVEIDELVAAVVNSREQCPPGDQVHAFREERIPLPGRPLRIELGLLDDDSRLDLLVDDATNEEILLLPGRDQGAFDSPRVVDKGPLRRVRGLADLDGDGIPDLLMKDSENGRILLLRGDGRGGFLPWLSLEDEPIAQHFVVGDVDRNGTPDVLTSHFVSGLLGVRLGVPAGGFGETRLFNVGGLVGPLALGHLVSEENLDAAVIDLRAGMVIVLRGLGQGDFEPAEAYPTGGRGGTAILVVDVTDDLRPDVIVVNGESSDVTVLVRREHVFARRGPFAVGRLPTSVAVGDVNNDGVLDLAFSNLLSNDVSILLGKGDGEFDRDYRAAVGLYPTNVIVADVDGDGQLDIVTGNRDSQDVSLLLHR